MNFSRLRSESVLGRLARVPLRAIPAGATVRVLQGPLRGTRWIAGASTHGAWLGSYEAASTVAFASAVERGAVVFDIGAHVGYYTLLGARMVGSDGRVIAFEPWPANVACLRRHLALNDVHNVDVVEAAVGATSGTARFATGPHSTMGRLADDGEFTTPVVALDHEIADGRLPIPAVLKIDVEGAELDVFDGATELFARHRPRLLLSTHGADLHHEACRRLGDLDYRLEPLNTSDLATCDELLATPR